MFHAIANLFRKIRSFKRCVMPSCSDLASAGRNVEIGFPVYITFVEALHMEENTVLRAGASIQNNENENVYVKKYTVISRDVTIVTNNHRSTVGIPQCLLGASHINDSSHDMKKALKWYFKSIDLTLGWKGLNLDRMLFVLRKKFHKRQPS